MSGVFSPFTPLNGQLPSSQGNIIVCPGGTNLYVKKLLLFNNNAAVQSFQLWLVPSGGTPTCIGGGQLAQSEFAEVLEHGESITLTPGDAIQGVTTTAAAVDYTGTGVQEV